MEDLRVERGSRRHSRDGFTARMAHNGLGIPTNDHSTLSLQLGMTGERRLGLSLVASRRTLLIASGAADFTPISEGQSRC